MLRKPLLKRVLLISLGLLVIAAIAITYKVNSSLEDLDMNTDKVILTEEAEADIKDREATRLEEKDNIADLEKEPEDFYMLLIGLDYRESLFSLNTDSIIVTHVIPQNKTIKLVSLPRDLRVERLGHQYAKVNSVFAEGYQHALAEGRKDPSLLSGKRARIGSMNVHEEYITSGSVLLRETIEKYMEIDIDYTFLVNFQTVTSLVDEIGGIQIDVDRSMQYDDPTDDTHIHLEKGLQVLNGEDALNFSRFREDNRGVDFYSNDFERGIRQQEVIMALASEMSDWSNITKIFNLLDIISTNFKTDMGTNTMASLVRTFHGHLNSETMIPIPFKAYWDSSTSYSKIKNEDLEQFKKEFISIEVPEPSIEVSME